MSDLFLTTYFTSKQDPQRKKYWGEDPSLALSWIESLGRLGLRGVIFHDGLSEEFVRRLTTDYVSFEEYRLKTCWSLNDERYLCWLEFLKENPQDYVVTTDLFDVFIHRDPFAFMRNDRYTLYVGSANNLPIGRSCSAKVKQQILYKEVHHPEKVDCNAGVIGGLCHDVIRLFEKVVSEFSKYNSTQNVNMGVVNKIVYDLFPAGKVLVGEPFTNRFRSGVIEDHCYIKHK